VFFALSKLLLFLTKPLTWALVCLLIGLFTKNALRKKRFFLGAVLLLFFFGNAVLFNEVMLRWEGNRSPLPAPKTPGVAVVLGGYASWDPARQRGQLTEAGDRIFGAIRLYHSGLVRKVLITGGAGDLFQKQRSEATYVRQMLIETGIPDSAILAEAASRNTHENAVFTRRLCDSLKVSGPFYLLTSAAHMPRSLGCFRKAGIEVQALPQHYVSKAGRGYNFQDYLLPSAYVLNQWEPLLKEWVGVLAYRLSGKI
jgi:uncharacterized SAM-binding protein YcdF (DUF218 family)